MSILRIIGQVPIGKRELVILDRDGTLNYDSGYTYEINRMNIIDGVVETLSHERFENSIFAIASNQAGISKGIFTIEDSFSFTEELCRRLRLSDIEISAYVLCPHADSPTTEEDRCTFRKPNPGMLNLLMKVFEIPNYSTIYFGNADSDELAAEAAGVSFIRVGTKFPRVEEFH